MKYYILAAFITLTFFYSVYFYLDAESIVYHTEEDRLFEWVTVLFFLAASFIGLRLFLRTKNVIFVLFFVAFFFAAGEEISWGQRLLGFETPAAIKEKNVQQEFTLHNIELFNQINLQGQPKSGLSRFLEINFLFRLGTIAYGIFLPLLVFHFSSARSLAKKLKVPVPPVSVGIFFLINWGIYRMIHTTMPDYPGGGSEIFESLGALFIFLICLFFLLERNNIDYIGADIKESVEDYPYAEELPEFQRKH